MKKSLVIFGLKEMAELAFFYFSKFSQYEVVAFTVDADYIVEPTFCGLPVVPFEQLTESYPPERYELFIALAYSKLNLIRKEKYLFSKQMGYVLASFVSPHATVLNNNQIGDNCFIFEDNTIQPFVTLGNNITLWSGNHIGHHSSIGDHCFIASHAVISGGVEIGESCFIGVNATLRDHIRVGERCVIGAGALLLADADADGVYLGAATERSRVPSNRLRQI
jgi:sugar O-acyltransferase (sialic acid O-acetyltransferase NeuD family)